MNNRADKTTYTDRKSRHVNYYELKRKNLASFTLIWYGDMDNILIEKHQEILLKLRQSIHFVIAIYIYDTNNEFDNELCLKNYEKVSYCLSKYS